ncbi:MAG: BTAD domain-containing putative transcriptional regulator [Gemmatimonadales bacterium]
MIELRTLGALELRGCEAQELDALVSQPKRVALLVYLAVATPSGFHRRDSLLAIFWPESDQSHARGALRNALSFLRHHLGEAVVATRGDEVGLDPVSFWCDVTVFRTVADADRAREALSLYRGDLLEGFHVADAPDFESWLEGERHSLRSRAARAAWALAASEERAGNWADAAGHARYAVTLSPDYERAACRLIELLDRAGDRGAALQEYRALETRLAQELEVPPSPETLSLMQAIRAREGPRPPVRSPTPTRGLPESLGLAAPVRLVYSALPRWAAVAGLLGLVAAGVILSGSRTDLPLDANLLAVAPFDVLDPSLHVWHEGLVDILSRDLDGAGPLRTVAQSVGIKRWKGRADRVSAGRFGHRTGAGLVVFGSVSRTRDTVSLRATVLDLANKKAGPDLEVKGDTADIGNLADSLGVRILQLLGQDRPIGAVRQVSIGSRSLPALKAFLYGEQFYRRGVWDSALVYYHRATTQDSTFAIAFKGMGMAVDWHPANEQSYLRGVEYFRKAVVLNRGLSPKDSMQVAADSFDIAAIDATDPADLIRFSYRWYATLEDAAHRYPEDPEVWYRLGDARFHSDPPFGGPPGPALEAFDRAIALDSGFAPAYEHTVTLAILLNRPDLARKYAAAYLRLDPTDVNAPSIRLSALMLDPERSRAPEAALMIAGASAFVLGDVGSDHLGWWADSGETGIRLLREQSRRSGNGVLPWSDTLMYRQFLARGLASRGHLREAYAVDRRLLLDSKASRFSWYLDPFLSLSLLGAIPESLAATTFARAFDRGTTWPVPRHNVQPRQLRGLPWWLARGDTASLARFARRAEQDARGQTSAQGKLRDRYLRAAAVAYLALARADSVQALRLFQSIPDTLCIANVCSYEKGVEARLLLAAGRAQQAEVVLDRWVWKAEGPFFVLGRLEQGRIAERLGERQKARDAYQFVVDVWRHADAELGPYIREARAGLERLAAEDAH